MPSTRIAWLPSSGDEHHDRWKAPRRDLPCRLNPADARHANVHQHQIGTKTFCALDALLATARRANPFKTDRRVDQLVGGILERELVVDHQHPDRRARDASSVFLGGQGASRADISTRSCPAYGRLTPLG